MVEMFFRHLKLESEFLPDQSSLYIVVLNFIFEGKIYFRPE